MADSMRYLRFDRCIPGRSKYRPWEGWIDVLAGSPLPPTRHVTGPWNYRDAVESYYSFTIDAGAHPVVTLINQACNTGVWFDYVVYDVLSGKKLVRLTL